jgi:hypothetical protein
MPDHLKIPFEMGPNCPERADEANCGLMALEWLEGIGVIYIDESSDPPKLKIHDMGDTLEGVLAVTEAADEASLNKADFQCTGCGSCLRYQYSPMDARTITIIDEPTAQDPPTAS